MTGERYVPAAEDDDDDDLSLDDPFEIELDEEDDEPYQDEEETAADG